MAGYTTKQLKRKLDKTGLRLDYAKGWDDPAINPFGVSPSVGVVMHHTANGGAKGNNPSVYWQCNNEYAPVRAAHFNIGRDGLVTVISGSGAYHAGAGRADGGMNIGGTWVPSVSGNKLLVGIEIESKGTSANKRAKPGDVDGYTPAQIKAATILAAAMCELMGVTADSVLNHADWAPGRKNDTLLPRSFWQGKVRRKMLANKATRLLRR
jgi:N-acetyl-anhydromuramyl-L-alanine amidase AmpD